MLTADFDYVLPRSAVAQRPLAQRDLCRLCVVDRASERLEHRRFREIGDYLGPGDLLVLNDSKVARCRIPCRRQGSGGSVEVFLVEPPGPPGRRWKAFLKPARRAKPGVRLECVLGSGAFVVLRAQQEESAAEVEWLGPTPLNASVLEHIGLPPLPPYIHRPRLPDIRQLRADARSYQTVYAGPCGSAAAPTAGLHFTRRLMSQLARQGVRFAKLTLHVGPGTFLPVKSERLEDHIMHEEIFYIGAETIRAVEKARRVIAVGTTTLRALESFESPGWSRTRLFIQPGYTFKRVHALITNFHQPRSTLLALVSAFYSREGLLHAYRVCLSLGYRFLSYGDAMFIF